LLKLYDPVIWKKQIGLVMGAACSRDHLISRLQAAPTRDFYGDLNMGLILKASYAICIIIIPAFLTRFVGL